MNWLYVYCIISYPAYYLLLRYMVKTNAKMLSEEPESSFLVIPSAIGFILAPLGVVFLFAAFLIFGVWKDVIEMSG